MPADEGSVIHNGPDIFQAEDSNRAELLHNQARDSWHRFKQGGQRKDLDECITLNREALALRPIGHTDRLKSLGNLAITAMARFKQDGQREDLDELIAFTWEVIGILPVDHPHRSTYISYLATALENRFKQGRQQEDLDDSITLHREALVLRPGHPNRLMRLINLANAVMTQFDHTGQQEDLDEYVTLRWEALALLPVDDPRHSVFLKNLAGALGTRFMKSRQQEDLDDYITLNREVLALRPNHLMSSLLLVIEYLATHGGTGDHQTGDTDLDGAESPLKELWTLLIGLNALLLKLAVETPVAHTGLDDHQSEDTGPTSTEGTLVSIPQKLLAAFALLLGAARNPIFSNSTGIPQIEGSILTEALHSQSIELSNRFMQSGNMEDLEGSITLNREALALRPVGHPDRSLSLNNLAAAVLIRFEQCGQQEDLDECVMLNLEALSLRPLGHPHRSSTLMNLANAAMTRFKQDGQREDLDKCITLHRKALSLRPLGHPHRSMSLNNLASAVITRFEQDGQRGDLNECITLNREALFLVPLGHPDRSRSLNNLANAVVTRFKQSGQREDLDECITLHREALSLRPLGHPYRSMTLNNLAGAVVTRFEQGGQREDLDECITLHREALSLRPLGHPDRYMSLSNLAVTVLIRFEQGGQREDLDECILFIRETLFSLPLGHPHRSISLSNLAEAVMNRFNQDGQREDLDECITLNREALSLRSLGHPYRYMSLNNLANAFRIRFEQDGQREDLNECITLIREALSLVPLGHPDRSRSLNNLANAVRIRFEQDHRLEDLDESMELREPASLDTFSSLSLRLNGAADWAEVAQSWGHHTTLKAYETALSLLQRALTISPTSQKQQALLGERGYWMMALDAASCAIEKGDIRKAIELLEQGRGFFWSQMRGLRTPLDKLSEIDKLLADRFRETSNRLETLATMPKARSFIFEGENTRNHTSAFSTISMAQSSASGTDNHSAEGGRIFDEILLERRHLSEEYEAMIQEIQNLPGFNDFLRPTPFETLRRAANEGPIIVINHSRNGSDCLIILKDAEPVRIHLSESFFKEALEQVKQLLNARKLLGSAEYDDALSLAMKWLWENAIRHLVEKLGELGIKKQSRIWLCPTSLLTFLPIHAAGPYEDDDGFIQYLLDDYVCSYTSTLKALIDARANIEQLPGGNAQKPSLLVIGQPGKGNASLLNVPVEVNVIRNRAKVCLENEQTTKNMVLQSLRNSNWVHFACHGHLNPMDPFNSSFELFDDERLTLLNIVENKLPGAEFAFLSACHSAALSLQGSPDEVLHLAAAMQFCGFRSVIGTMWAMSDADGPFVVEKFYKRIFAKKGAPEIGFRRSARSLQKSVLDLREKAVGLERWVNFIHIGA